MKIDVTRGTEENYLRVRVEGYGDNNHQYNIVIEDDDVDRLISMIDGLIKYQMNSPSKVQGQGIHGRMNWQTLFAVACGTQLK